jgi:hypothetical protein
MAGAGYKLFQTGDVLTAAQVNTYLNEQTVMVFASSAARTTALSGVLAEGMMSYLQDTNAVEVYNGTAWVAVGGMTNPMTTTGDVIYSSSGSTPARLGIGTAGQILKVNSGATAPEWGAATSGGMTSLATGTLSTGTVTLSAIDQTYNDLSLRIYKPSTTSASGTVYFRYNGITTASYKYNYLDTSTTTVNGDTGKTSLDLFVAGTAVTNTYIQLDFPGYSLVSGQTVGKAVDFFAAIEASGKSQYGQFFVDTATAQAPITSITIFTAAGTFDAGTYTLWGIK